MGLRPERSPEGRQSDVCEFRLPADFHFSFKNYTGCQKRNPRGQVTTGISETYDLQLMPLELATYAVKLAAYAVTHTLFFAGEQRF